MVAVGSHCGRGRGRALTILIRGGLQAAVPRGMAESYAAPQLIVPAKGSSHSRRPEGWLLLESLLLEFLAGLSLES